MRQHQETLFSKLKIEVLVSGNFLETVCVKTPRRFTVDVLIKFDSGSFRYPEIDRKSAGIQSYVYSRAAADQVVDSSRRSAVYDLAVLLSYWAVF